MSKSIASPEQSNRLPARLAELESVIERGQQTFIEVGMALLEIRDSRLYREQFTTFEDYCQKRWGWSRRYANYHIEAAEVVVHLGTIVPKPATESQARELAPLLREAPDAMPEVWQRLNEQHGDRLTAAAIREAVQEFIGAEDDEAEVEPPPDPAPAGRLAVHFTSDSPEWYTPRHIIQRVADALGSIDLDPCSNSHDNPNVPALRHFTIDDDGLSREWTGRVYMNPPYGREIVEWVEKLSAEYERGSVVEAVALVPARTDTAWFRRLNAEYFCFIAGRLTFSEHESAAPFPSVAVYLGEHPQAFIEAFRDVGSIYRRLSDGMEAA